MLAVEKITLDYEATLSGTETLPVLGWVIASDRRNVEQTSWRLQIAQCADFLTLCYDSGDVQSDQSNNVVLPSLALISSSLYYVRVRVRDNQHNESDWSPTARFSTGLPAPEWLATFISAETPQDKDNSKATLLRRSFTLPDAGEIESAVIHASALGLYQLFLNGQRIGDDELAPGWTSYHHHLRYQTYDVTGQVQRGENALGAMVGAGWYKGDMSFNRYRNYYGEQTAFISQLVVRYRDGRVLTVITDDGWKAADAPVLFSEFYDGEIYDARQEQPGWNTVDFDDAAWRNVSSVARDKSVLRPQTACAVRAIERLAPCEMISTPQGDIVIDFGQNMSGWVEFTVCGEAGQKVVLRHFEVLDASGNVYLDNLRTAKQCVEYTLRGGEPECYHPHFTFQGFRYVRVEQWPGTPQLSAFSAIVLHSAMEPTASLETSREDLNQLHHNIVWGLKGNFVDVPTDCPQRDERLGWTGDAQIFCRTASYLMQTRNFFAKWLLDLQFDQTEEGGVPHVVPDILTGKCDNDRFLSDGRTHSSAAWGDAAVINPWTLYLMYGDIAILRQQYDSMKAWIDFMRAHAVDHQWNYLLQFGDWVALDAKEGSYFGATPNELTCMAYYAYSTQLFANTARILGHDADYREYSALHQAIVQRFGEVFFTPTGCMTARTQTAHILALHFNLVPPAYRERTVQTLLQLLEENDGHLVTGFVGTPYFCHALSENGQSQAAWRLLLKEDFPSWLYQVHAGATTIWEHWDGIKPDGSMWSPEMNSFNHYAYGAIAEWLYRVAAGINPDEQEPGFKRIHLQPMPGGDLTWLKVVYRSLYGDIGVHWARTDDDKCITLTVSVPANTRADIVLDGAVQVLHGDGVSFTRQHEGMGATLGSGCYRLTYLTA